MEYKYFIPLFTDCKVRGPCDRYEKFHTPILSRKNDSNIKMIMISSLNVKDLREKIQLA